MDDAAAVLDPFETVDWSKIATTDETGRLRSEFDGVRSDVKELRSDVKELRSDVKELRRDLIRITGAQFFALFAAVAAVVGLQ